MIAALVQHRTLCHLASLLRTWSVMLTHIWSIINRILLYIYSIYNYQCSGPDSHWIITTSDPVIACTLCKELIIEEIPSRRRIRSRLHIVWKWLTFCPSLRYPSVCPSDKAIGILTIMELYDFVTDLLILYTVGRRNVTDFRSDIREIRHILAPHSV
jgi:hypothetical protein